MNFVDLTDKDERKTSLLVTDEEVRVIGVLYHGTDFPVSSFDISVLDYLRLRGVTESILDGVAVAIDLAEENK